MTSTIFHLHRAGNLPVADVTRVLSQSVNAFRYIEGDIRCTADGVLVMSHDPVWYDLEIERNSYFLLNHFSPLPKLETLLMEMSSSCVGVNLEIKADGQLFSLYRSYILLNVIRMVKAYYEMAVYAPVPVVQCFELSVLDDLSYYLSFFSFPCHLSYLIEHRSELDRLLQMDVTKIAHVYYVSPDYRILNDLDDVHYLRSKGYRLLPWSVPYSLNHIYTQTSLNTIPYEYTDGAIVDIVY